MVLPELGQIRKRRQALGLTQQELADGSGVLRVVINQIENRKHKKKMIKYFMLIFLVHRFLLSKMQRMLQIQV